MEHLDPQALKQGLDGYYLPGYDDKHTTVNLFASHVLRVDTAPVNSLDERLKMFWELEALGIKEDKLSVYEFIESIELRDDRYCVKLPRKDPYCTLPSNYDLCQKRLYGLLRRLKQDTRLLKEYDGMIRDQLTKGIVEVEGDQTHPEHKRIHYLSHHAVIREEKRTTKLHIVYDTSARSTGYSLNDCLYVGPVFDQYIMDIMLRFRLQKVALTADIEKAFLMITVAEEDKDVLRAYRAEGAAPGCSITNTHFKRINRLQGLHLVPIHSYPKMDKEFLVCIGIRASTDQFIFDVSHVGKDANLETKKRDITQSKVCRDSLMPHRKPMQVVYLKSVTPHGVHVTFVVSKTRVASAKGVTIPRLELLAALLLSKLVVSKRTKEWKQFVQNRVCDIRRLLPVDVQKHRSGHENPTDIPSRGMHLAELANNPLLLNGPEWLCDSGGEILQVDEDSVPEGCLDQMKDGSCQLMQSSHNLLSIENGVVNSIIECTNFSTLRRLLRVTAHVLKVVEILKAKIGKGDAELTITTMAKSELYWVKIVQHRIETNVWFSTWKQQFKMFMDETGLWRCGGRLTNADIPQPSKHPILLEITHLFTTLIVKDCHEGHSMSDHPMTLSL
eukprot:Em0008g69a